MQSTDPESSMALLFRVRTKTKGSQIFPASLGDLKKELQVQTILEQETAGDSWCQWHEFKTQFCFVAVDAKKLS